MVKTKLLDFTVNDCTHNLRCVHQINWGSRKEYDMPCIILKELPNNRAKVLVFGYKTTKTEFTNGARRIRYISKDRLTIIKKDNNNEKNTNN